MNSLYQWQNKIVFRSEAVKAVIIYFSVHTFSLNTFSFLEFPVFFLSIRHHIDFSTRCGHERLPLAGGRHAAGCHRAKINSDRKMADLRKVCTESLPCRVNYTRQPSCQGKLFIFLCILIADSGGATTHWVVTEDGKIQQQV